MKQLVEADIWTVARTEHGNVLLLRPKGHKQVVPIVIRQLEAQSILIGLSRINVPRPLTHDLCISLLKYLSAKLVRVEIMAYIDEVFYAHMVINNGKFKNIRIDTRASDALGIAIRARCPITIHKKVIQETAISTSVLAENDHTYTADFSNNEIKIDQLEVDLKNAIETENYEEAARIRDKIQKMH